MEVGVRAANAIALVLLVGLTGCDGFVRARVKVVSTQGGGLPDALLRLERASDHDLARYTDPGGCAEFSGVVGPTRRVTMSVSKPGYEAHSLKLGIADEKCFVVHLVPNGEPKGSVETLPLQTCPCARETGYSPTLSVRFRVTTPDGAQVQAAGVRRSDRPRNPWLQVTDAAGCLGVKWIVPAGQRTIPLVLEKGGYQPATLEVPVMEDRCYTVRLSPTAGGDPSTVTGVEGDQCQCAMFTGQTVWPEQ
jgi:hypothetical protein